MKKVLLLLYLLLPTFIFAQEVKERRVYYLDCSLTMIGKAGGADIYDDVISNLVSAIDAVPNKETTELIVIPFAYNTTYSNTTLLGKTYVARATTSGKAALIQNVRCLPESPRECKGSTMTYHKDPIQDFIYHRANYAEKIYMFLLTDGDDDEYKKHKKKTFNNEIKKWSQHFNGKKVYAFYVMLNDKFKDTADYKERDALIKKVPYFWSIKTANVNVNTICPVSVDTLDLRKGGSIKIKFDGIIEGLNLKVKTDNQLKQSQDAKCIDKSTLEVFLEANVDCDVFAQSLSKHLTIIMPNANDGVCINNNTYNILVENGLDMPCVCQPGNNISIRNKNHSNWSCNENIVPIKTTDLLLNPDNELGTIKYFAKSVFYPKDSIIRAVNTFTFTYNKKAQEVGSYAKLRFVTKDSCLNNKNFKIFVNNKELIDKTILVKKTQTIECSFWMSSDVPEGEYTISLELLDNDLMFFNDKTIPDNKIVQTWTIKHEKILNPFWIWFWRLAILLLLLLLLTVIALWLYSEYRKHHAPKFTPNYQISFRGSNNVRLLPNSNNSIYKETADSPIIKKAKISTLKLLKKIPFLNKYLWYDYEKTTFCRENVLIWNTGNEIRTHVLSNSFVKYIAVFNKDSYESLEDFKKRKGLYQSWYNKYKDGRIIIADCDFNEISSMVDSIFFIPQYDRNGKISLKIIINYRNDKVFKKFEEIPVSDFDLEEGLENKNFLLTNNTDIKITISKP